MLSRGRFLACWTSRSATLTASSRREFRMFSSSTRSPELLRPMNTMKTITRAIITSMSVRPWLFFHARIGPIVFPQVEPRGADPDAVVVRRDGRGEADVPRRRGGAVPVEGEIRRAPGEDGGDRVPRRHAGDQRVRRVVQGPVPI